MDKDNKQILTHSVSPRAERRISEILQLLPLRYGSGLRLTPQNDTVVNGYYYS